MRKFIKMFESFVNETGEWNKNIDLTYVEENPLANDEFSEWIRIMKSELDEVKSLLDNPEDLVIINITGFDKYQGPVASVKIKGVSYKIWTNNNLLWIENYIVDNTSGERGLLFVPVEAYMNPGFIGNVQDIADVINKN